MIERNTRVFAELGQFGSRVDVHLIADLPDGRYAVAQPLSMEVMDHDRVHGELQPAALTMHHGTAQLIMDELWRIGFRPAEGTGSAGALAATERHLKDMQGIVHGLLRKDGVESRT